MSVKMITCCPACSTLFKVEPEQLRIAGGWVRCGQCMVAFDARARMLPADLYVPPDAPWNDEEERGESGGAPPPGQAESPVDAEPRTAPDQPVDAAALKATARVPPEPRREAPAVEPPAFAAVPFELVPPPVPEEPAPMPVFIGKPPDRTATPQAVAPQALAAADAGGATGTAAAPASPPLALPTDDELDRRHAQLLETLARLREDTERRKRELEQTDAGLHNGDVLGLNPRDGGRSGLPRTAPPRDAGRETRRRAAAPEREPAHERKRGYEGRPREPQRAAARTKDPRAEREARRNEQAGQEPLSRPMIDFVLSEIGRPLPLPAAPPPQSEPWPAPRIQTEPAVPSFVEQARRRAFWELPRMRAGLWVAAGILVLTLAVQVAVGLRDSLVAQHPGVRPLLQALCRPARCQITPWRHLDAVVIDSSALARTGSDAFRFAVTLRNNGAAPVAMPALELALTDALNQPLARRVLSPADWGAPLQLAAHGEFNGTAQLTVGREANPQAVNNYLLSAFYP